MAGFETRADTFVFHSIENLQILLSALSFHPSPRSNQRINPMIPKQISRLGNICCCFAYDAKRLSSTYMWYNVVDTRARAIITLITLITLVTLTLCRPKPGWISTADQTGHCISIMHHYQSHFVFVSAGLAHT
jgi:hypothetical protein